MPHPHDPQEVTSCLEVTDAIVAINPSAYYDSLYVNLLTGRWLTFKGGPDRCIQNNYNPPLL